MDKERLEYFRNVLTQQLRQRSEFVRDNQQGALDAAADDGVKDSVDMALQDVNQELAFRLGERESQMVADIDQALMRIDEGGYGICLRCEQPIDERRLEALPAARYDAACQTLIEANEGLDEDHATL